MREQLINYVSLLFAGTKDADDVRQEIMQNTLDRYDDMIAQGKTPEAAYRLAISGIGDINEILNTIPGQSSCGHAASMPADTESAPTSKIISAIAVGLYILCPIPLFVLTEMNMETTGLCGTIVMVAVATVLLMLGKKKSGSIPKKTAQDAHPENDLTKSIDLLIWAVGLALYFIISFSTQAWYITWVIFPMIATVQGIVKACMDLKGGK